MNNKTISFHYSKHHTITNIHRSITSLLSASLLLFNTACSSAQTHCPKYPLPAVGKQCQPVFAAYDTQQPIGYVILSADHLHAQLFYPPRQSSNLDNVKGGYVSTDGSVSLQWNNGRLLLRQSPMADLPQTPFR